MTNKIDNQSDLELWNSVKKSTKKIITQNTLTKKVKVDNLKNNDFLISENLKINEPELLFSRIEDSEIQKQIDKLNKNN